MKYSLGFLSTGAIYLVLGGAVIVVNKKRLAGRGIVPEKSIEELEEGQTMAEERDIESGASGQPVERRRAKSELQRQMHEARDSISHAVEEIKETVEGQYEAVKRTVDGVLAWRDQFQKDPIVWSVGALSAGFALGYTLGYAHKTVGRSRGGRSEVASFADSLIDELSAVGNSLVMPSLNSKIKELFGFDFSDMLEEIGSARNRAGRKGTTRRTTTRRRTRGGGTKEGAARGEQERRPRPKRGGA